MPLLVLEADRIANERQRANEIALAQRNQYGPALAPQQIPLQQPGQTTYPSNLPLIQLVTFQDKNMNMFRDEGERSTWVDQNKFYLDTPILVAVHSSALGGKKVEVVFREEDGTECKLAAPEAVPFSNDRLHYDYVAGWYGWNAKNSGSKSGKLTVELYEAGKNIPLCTRTVFVDLDNKIDEKEMEGWRK